MKKIFACIAVTLWLLCFSVPAFSQGCITQVICTAIGPPTWTYTYNGTGSSMGFMKRFEISNACNIIDATAPPPFIALPSSDGVIYSTTFVVHCSFNPGFTLTSTSGTLNGWVDWVDPTNYTSGKVYGPVCFYTPTPTPYPTATASPSPTITATFTPFNPIPTPTPTPTQTPSPTNTSTGTVTPTFTDTPLYSYTPTISPTTSSTPTITPTFSPHTPPTGTPSYTPTVFMSSTPSPIPTNTPKKSYTPTTYLSPTPTPSDLCGRKYPSLFDDIYGGASHEDQAFSCDDLAANIFAGDEELRLFGFDDTNVGSIYNARIYIVYRTTNKPRNDEYRFEVSLDGTFSTPIVLVPNTTDEIPMFRTVSLDLGSLTYAEIAAFAVREKGSLQGAIDPYGIAWECAYLELFGICATPVPTPEFTVTPTPTNTLSTTTVYTITPTKIMFIPVFDHSNARILVIFLTVIAAIMILKSRQ